MSYSIIIPIYNEERTLKNLLLELETLNDEIEIIIINDGSTDNSREILNTKKSFKILHNQKNMGKGYSIIRAVDFAESKSIINGWRFRN